MTESSETTATSTRSATTAPDITPGRARALVTGASSGLGAVFAERLAARRHDLTLVARRVSRLDTLARQITDRHGVEARVLAADLSTPALEDVIEHARTHEIDVLVNNAGFGEPGDVVEVDPDRLEAMIAVHVRATVRLSRAVLPSMIARRSGAVINVSSIAGFMANPGAASYCASKAYVTTFSRALAEEVGENGVVVQALCPGFTRTEFHDGPQYEDFRRERVPRAWWMEAEEVVDASLAALEKRSVVVIPGRMNRLIHLVYGLPGAAQAARWVKRRLRPSQSPTSPTSKSPTSETPASETPSSQPPTSE